MWLINKNLFQLRYIELSSVIITLHIMNVSITLATYVYFIRKILDVIVVLNIASHVIMSECI